MDEIQLSGEAENRINQQAEVFAEKFDEIVSKINDHHERLVRRKEHLEVILQELTKIVNNFNPNVTL